MWHPKMIEFDERMKKLFDEVDACIENLYGSKYSLHPTRPARGETSNPEADGLFNIGLFLRRATVLSTDAATLLTYQSPHWIT